MKYRVLAIDDQLDNLQPTKELLESWGYSVDAVTSGEEGLTLAKNPFIDYATILLDFNMPGGMDGFETASEIRKYNPDAVILMYSCDESRDALKNAYRAGILDFIDKDESLERLREALKGACAKYDELKVLKPSQENKENQELLASLGMVGRSSAMANVAKSCISFREVPHPALIIGETGSGKELVARALHKDQSTPFLAVNCGAFSNGNLLESELFGYEKGAFTGANQAKAGIMECARGGTVFLDEIHHLSQSGQVSLLRALREKRIRRVGANRETEISCKVIAAAKPEIREMIKDGRFLPDLYYRLMIQIDMPPLRDRKEDIEFLVLHFCKKFEKDTGQKKQFRDRTIRALEEYSWPGNVGELEGYVNKLLAIAPKDVVSPVLLDERFRKDGFVSGDRTVISTLGDFDKKQEQDRRDYLANALRMSRSRRRAAERLGINESSLRRLIANLKIEEPQFQEASEFSSR